MGIEEEAGIADFERYGIMNLIDRLAGGDASKYEDVLRLDNATVLVKEAMSATRARYEREYERLSRRKK